MSDEVRSHPLVFSDAALDDLRERLARTRWPDKEIVDNASQGAPLARIRRLIARWQDGYDWRSAEARLNALGPTMTAIDGVDIHFPHVRSPEPDAMPIPLLTDPRTHGGDPKDAFHVVVPSMPGFGLSGKPTEPGWSPDGAPRHRQHGELQPVTHRAHRTVDRRTPAGVVRLSDAERGFDAGPNRSRASLADHCASSKNQEACQNDDTTLNGRASTRPPVN